MLISKSNSVFHQLDLSLLRHFFDVATYRGFSRASKATGVSQPALSLGLKKLEKALGKELVDRSTRSFQLTEAGKSLLTFCQRFQGQLESELTDLGVSGISVHRRISIGTALPIGFTPVNDLVSKTTSIDEIIEWEFTAQNTYQLLEDVFEGKLHGAFVPNDVFDSRMHTIPILQDRIVFIVGRNSRNRHSGKDWKEGISKVPLITYPRDTPMRAVTDNICVSQKLEFKGVCAVSGIEGVKLLVKSGHGGAFVLRKLVELELANEEVFIEPLPITLPRSGVSFILRQDSLDDPNSKLLARLLKAH